MTTLSKKWVITDLDGTIADIMHRIHFVNGQKKDYNAFFRACSGDVVFEWVKEFLTIYAQSGWNIFIVSGRSDCVKQETIDWLMKNRIPFDDLRMREDGDYTQDDILKEKWVQRGFLPTPEETTIVLDDRKRVVDMWRRNNYRCLQVAEGNF